MVQSTLCTHAFAFNSSSTHANTLSSSGVEDRNGVTMDPCVTFVTGNANKLREVKAILEPAIRVQSIALDLEEIQGTIQEVTEYKCRKAAHLVRPACCFVVGRLSEIITRVLVRRSTAPSWLRIPPSASTPWANCQAPTCNSPQALRTPLLAVCLHGASRLYSKWFLSAIGHDGLNNLLAAYTDKSADAVCTFGYSPGPDQTPILFQGRCPVGLASCRQPTRPLLGLRALLHVQGKIVPPRGPSNFSRLNLPLRYLSGA